MKIVSTFIHNDVTFGLDSEGKYWILTPVLPLPISPSVTQEETTPQSKIFIILKNLEMPQHFLGFDYLITAISLVNENPEYRKSIVKGLYSDVGKIHHSTSNQVERAIRNAIQHCKANDFYFQVFGTKEPVTSKQFIITLVKQLNI